MPGRRVNLKAMAKRIASLQPWEILGETTLFSNNIVTLVGVLAKSKKTGLQKQFTVSEYPDWVHVAALTDKGEIVLVRQFRHGVGEFTLELPGGAVDPGESADQAAPRELAEETKYASAQWEPLGALHANPAINTNRVHMFFAKDVVLTDGLPADQGEELEVMLVPLTAAVKMCREGAILHPFTHAAVFALLAAHPELLPKP